MSVKTKVKSGTYKGYPICTIVPVDDMGQECGKPIVSFGVKKAQAILDNIDGIKRYVQNNVSPTSADKLNLDNMSQEEKNKLLAKLLAV